LIAEPEALQVLNTTTLVAVAEQQVHSILGSIIVTIVAIAEP
jgi:hypothetical protein